MTASRRPSFNNPRLVTLIIAALAICLIFVVTVSHSPAPAIDLKSGDTAIFLSAQRAWTFYPGDCLTFEWQLEGIESLHIDGAGAIGWGELDYCPDINATSPLFEVRAQNGIYRALKLPVQHLPDLLFYLAGFVIFVGSPLLALYYFWLRQLDRPLPLHWILLGGMLLIALGAWLRLTPHDAPLIDEPAVRIWADHDRSLFPHECVRVWWSAPGAQSIHFNGRAIVNDENPAYAEHCAEDGEEAQIEVIKDAGANASYSLAIPALFPQRTVPPPFFYASLLGILLGIAVYAPLLWRYARARLGGAARTDWLAVAGCFLVVFLLYLPFGFDSSGHWEEWIIHGYTEGGTLSFYVTEAVSRPWVMVPHTLAYLISSDSFIGYHLVNFAQYAGRMALLYIILRQLGVAPLYAFLTAILFMVYPVNDALMTLRRLPKNFSVLTLLLSTALFIDYCKTPRRLTLLGVWLGLLFSVNSNETGYALILIVPPLLWLRDRRFSWRRLNLSAIWYIVPAFKLASVLLLLANARDFYQSGLLSAPSDPGAPGVSVFDTIFEVLGLVYPQSFVHGWADALATLAENMWWPPTLAILALVALFSWHCIRNGESDEAPTIPQIALSLAAGLALVFAAVGVLMWLPLYRHDPWRMYLLVPVGAAVSAVSLILLLASPIRAGLRRNAAVLGLCLLLMAPAVSRLFLQHHHFNESARAKAHVLYQVLEIAPKLAPGTQVALVTDMGHAALRARGVFDLLHNDMLNSALYALYQADASEYAYFCHSIDQCGDFSGDETIFDAPDLLARTLVFALQDDLSVDLIADPAAYLSIDQAPPYELGALYEAEAPLPPRASTMLARFSTPSPGPFPSELGKGS